MAKMSTADLLSVFEEMTVLELKEFLDAFESHFDVTAAASMAVAMAPGDGAAAEPEEEQVEFDLVLTSSGEAKIQVIKEVRKLATLGLKEAKGLVDGIPNTLLEAVSKEEAEAAKAKIEAVGGSAELR